MIRIEHPRGNLTFYDNIIQVCINQYVTIKSNFEYNIFYVFKYLFHTQRIVLNLVNPHDIDIA